MDAQEIVSNIAFTTSGSLVDCVDKKMVVLLRDGKKLIGVLRSYDQFANLVLQDTIERVYVGNRYGDIPRGVFLVRGENVVLLGEIDLDAEDEVPPSIASPLPPNALPQLLAAREAELESKSRSDARKAEILRKERGFCVDKSGDGDLY
ncbi:Sm-like ribonucleo protein [Violaceomyces palustris]|uniref:Sm-like ribonucleo protein n=1 Tax=Violaceomyces palustris TaxID=1673888 RepID=A0ACD0NL58_9BASI|nr:Sm-like ribonucleo protein [Violaceomyces palustris]